MEESLLRKSGSATYTAQAAQRGGTATNPRDILESGNVALRDVVRDIEVMDQWLVQMISEVFFQS